MDVSDVLKFYTILTVEIYFFVLELLLNSDNYLTSEWSSFTVM